jgi:hypothetical protein
MMFASTSTSISVTCTCILLLIINMPMTLFITQMTCNVILFWLTIHFSLSLCYSYVSSLHSFSCQLQSIIISPKYGNSWHNLLIVAKDEDTMYLSCYTYKTFHEHVTNYFQFFAHEF